MNILAVDDERHALELLRKGIGAASPGCSIHCFTGSDEALAYAQAHPVDVAFLDIRIDELDGLQLARRLRELYAGTNIVFVTGYESYMPDAFQIHASGYVQKPVSAEDIAVELENLRHPVPRPISEVRIQTFGSFEVFVRGRAVHFGRSKSKEILAYLVDRRGAGVNRKQLAAILWGDQPYSRQKQNQLQNLIAEMMRALRDVGADGIVLRERGSLYLVTDRVDCDLYRFDRWDPLAVNSYRGEYMVDYSWAEFTAGALSRKTLQA